MQGVESASTSLISDKADEAGSPDKEDKADSSDFVMISRPASPGSTATTSKSETPVSATAPAPAPTTATALVPSPSPLRESAESAQSSVPLRTTPMASQSPHPSAPHGKLQHPHQYRQHQASPLRAPISIGSTPSPAPAPAPAASPQPGPNVVVTRLPSPEIDHQARIPRFKRDLSVVADAVQRSCPEAVRRIVRDKWDKCIMGSDFHHAFILNATLHHANGHIMRRAVRDFGKKMVSESKVEIATQLTKEDLDGIGDIILDKCSNEFLDKALEKRLKSIDARSLINALARAERLGYESSDVLEERQEGVHASHAPQAAMGPELTTLTQPPPPASITESYSYTPSQQNQNQNQSQNQNQGLRYAGPTELQCKQCWRIFTETKPYEFHVQKQLCTRQPPQSKHIFTCNHCGAIFTTKIGKQYHEARSVCGAHSTAGATPKTPATPATGIAPPTVSSNPSFTKFRPVQYPPAPAPTPPQRSSHKPALPASQFIPQSSPGSSQDDPYAHLSPELKAALMWELQQAELSHAPRFKEAEAIADPEQRRLKIESLQNTFSTKQSVIRRKYGVRLRKRRTAMEIDIERVRMGIAGKRLMEFSPDSESKRRKSDSDQDAAPRVLQSHTPIPPPSNHLAIPPPSNHLAVSKMTAGLGGSVATAATADPTTPQNSLSSLQRKGYRVSSHVSRPSQTTQSDASPVDTRRSGSASAPVVLDDSSEESDDTADEDIPATLPPKKV
ncbi:hypothetical protein GGS20DRAFT_579435 [Poronia punctata]|nr:hypothetical protein GGS20DRAFT_579435 [Poronia punctata]